MAETVRICGKVQGSVRAKSVLLTKSAQVMGDIMHDSLAIEAGAFIEGNIMRLDSKAPAPAQPAAPAQSAAPAGNSAAPQAKPAAAAGAKPA